MSPGPIQLDQATALTLMLGPNGSVGIQASIASIKTVVSTVLSCLRAVNSVIFFFAPRGLIPRAEHVNNFGTLASCI